MKYFHSPGEQGKLRLGGPWKDVHRTEVLENKSMHVEMDRDEVW